MAVAVGIDSHKATLSAAAVDELGRLAGQGDFSNDPRGHQALLRWALGQGEVIRFGVECSGSFGAALTRLLLNQGFDVREVPANLSHREAKSNPSPHKSDPSDALAIARVAAREVNLSLPRRNRVLQELKLLSDHRSQLVHDRTQAINRIHKDLVVLRPGYQLQIPKLTAPAHLSKVLRLLRGDNSVRAELVRRRVKALRRLREEIDFLNVEIKEKLQESGTSLTTEIGIGDVTAARILGEVGDAQRFTSRAAFAQMAGTAPLEASSGATKRHRLNRGGNRQLNLALHIVAVNRCRLDPATKAYMSKKQAEGKNKAEALRCLKRHLASAVYRRLIQDAARLEKAA
jgi:transposase